ncbi:hypothetical protein ACRBEV_00975 [Methylobacterium phyllosphaerae]
MTKLLDRAIARARTLSPAAQDELADVLLRLAGDDEAVYQLGPDEKTSFAHSLAQAERGEFASDEQIRAIWSKHGF